MVQSFALYAIHLVQAVAFIDETILRDLVLF
jgi:hypothetical protein